MTARIPPYIRRYEQFGLGLFLHWGLYSQIRQGEWYWNYHKPEKADYVKLADTFTAGDFDADELVRWAGGNGVRYICLTTRHHEGFSLYDTRGLNQYDAPHSAAGRDLVKEFSDACDCHGMGKFFYHTTLDWWHEDFDGDWDAYQQYLRDSVEILCTRYGKVDGLWFDGNWSRPERDWQEDALYAMIRGHQPECMIVNNSSIQAVGAEGHPMTDVITFEQGDAEQKTGGSRYRALEVCDTMNSHWGIGDFDLSYHSPADVVRRLVNCRKVGANLLMNIGPTAQGGIPAYERAVFDLVGRWIGLCPEALTSARPCQLAAPGGDVVLCDGSSYYYFCHDLEIHGNEHLSEGGQKSGWRQLDGALDRVSSVRWADNGEELEFEQGGDSLKFKATPYPYGKQLIVRVAVISTR
ncbi:MAG: alpha-L-fucosidase [Opitutales bacterium]